MPGPYDLDREQLAALLDAEPAYRQRQVWHGLYGLARVPSELTELPSGLRNRLAAALPPALSELARLRSKDGTVKWLWALHDGAQVETVLMPYADRATVCVSSQAGCAMGCQFCATGQGGFRRHLTAGEILEQVAAARREAAPRRVTNVVFMGMGEPLANYDRVWTAVERLHDDMGLSARHLTLSTVGIVPGIRRLAAEALPVNLAVSLHAANDELRNRLVPIGRRWPLSVLLETCADYIRAKGRRLSFEWALIDGVNDTNRDVAELARTALPLGAHVNLIPLNPTPGYPVRGSSKAAVEAFAAALVAWGVNATVRRNRGTDIEAACGQLAARQLSAST
ncbi:MAG: 23S rRNA (adenine(2503)-C(2))-methyltransferase RlmN [Acidimicrobiaceae bacterium]|nr:23S rRNA (adenine(2503)-C(2))-methyltransferase RlmN [Acidimicrobiaceae bacterium]